MALIESISIPLGTTMPHFKLNDANGTSFDSDDLFIDSKGLLVAFTCNHCPYAIAVWPRLIDLAEHAQELDIATVAINPNINPDYSEDSAEKMAEKVDEWDMGLPYLVDQEQSTAKAFKAQCTPDIYLFDANQKLVYHGRIDDNWKDPSKVTKEELKEAINALAAGTDINPDQKPTMGCSIKWC